MKRIRLCTILALCAKLSFALPNLAIPNLVYSPGVTNIGINNIDVRGALVKSGKFKVIEAPKGFNLASINTSDSGKQYDANQHHLSSESGHVSHDALIIDGLSYVLIGQVIATDNFDNTYQVPNTNSVTATRTLSVTVSYKLLRLKDKASVAAFNINATGSQTAILKSGETFRVNNPLILRETSQDLATKVIEQLVNYVDTSERSTQQESSFAPKVIVYDN